MNARTGSAERQASGWRDEIQDAWEDLPKSTRDELTKILDQLPGGLKGWRELLDHATRQIRFASGSKQKVAIVGPANAGKSTLFNALIRPSELQAPVSAIPGTTRQVQEGDAGLFSIVDTPGTDVVGDLGVEERQRALNAAAVADVLIVLFDASHGVRAPEKRILGELLSLDRPTVVALNKMDLVRKERAEVVGKAAAALGLQSDQLIHKRAQGTGAGSFAQGRSGAGAGNCRGVGSCAACLSLEACPGSDREGSLRRGCGRTHSAAVP